MQEIFVPSSQFYCEPKTALKQTNQPTNQPSLLKTKKNTKKKNQQVNLKSLSKMEILLTGFCSPPILSPLPLTILS